MKAFSFVELVVVIVAIGLLAVFIMPKFQRNDLDLAADQVLSHIRYTQHLALVDDKYDALDEYWFKSRWQIYFHTYRLDSKTQHQTYTVFSDFVGAHTGNPDAREIAKNPLNPSKMLSTDHSGIFGIKKSPELDLTATFSIADVNFRNCKTKATRIMFDEIGRPYVGRKHDSAYDGLMDSPCTIELVHKSNDKICIVIEPITGYAHIDRNCMGN